MSPHYILAHAILPFSRLEFPGWGWLARPLGVFSDERSARRHWGGLPVRIVRGKLHGYRMALDLADWSQRRSWLLGRYYELDVQRLMAAILKPGDSFIDIGANIGMITLLAARLVGPSGRVLSVEPNPDPRALLRRHIEMNGIENVEIVDVALSDAVEDKTLSVVGDHDGVATLADMAGGAGVTRAHRLRTVVGDDAIPDGLPGSVLIKIDVEGYETKVLRGLSHILERYRPMVITEFEPRHLVRAGSSPEELISLMTGRGYKAFDIFVRRSPLRYKLFVEPMNGARARGANLLWAHESMADGLELSDRG